MFKRISLSVLFFMLLYGIAFAVPPVQITNDDGTPMLRGVVTSETVTMNDTTTKYVTKDTRSADKTTFYVVVDETEHIGAVKASHIAAAGTGYATDDVLTITGGGDEDCTLLVTSVDTGGEVLSYSTVTQGLGYSVGDTQATTSDTLLGADCTIHVTAIGGALSETISLEISGDGTNYQTASFYDYAGGTTLQTSEAISADGTYYFWTNSDVAAPYTRVKIVSASTDTLDTISNVITSDIVSGL